MYEIEKLYNGYIIYIVIEGKKHYLQGYRKGLYKFTLDYAYAKRYSKETAQKHINILKRI